MKIELIEFYPFTISEKKLQGTLRVKLTDHGIEILGVLFLKNPKGIFIRLPGKKTTHHQTGKEAWFPVVVFSDPALTKELVAEIKRQAPSFVEKRLSDPTNPNRTPPKAEPRKQDDRALMVKKTRPQSISKTGWMDMPIKNRSISKLEDKLSF